MKEIFCRNIVIVKVVLARPERDVRSMIKKASIILENTDTIANNVDRNMNAKDTPCEVSEENKKRVIGNWRKGNLCYEVVNTWLKCVMLGGKQNLYGINLDIHLRKFQAKCSK